MLEQPLYRSKTSWHPLRRSTVFKNCSILLWFSCMTSSPSEAYSDITKGLILKKLIEERGGPTIYEWLWGLDPPSPFVLVLLLSVFSLLVGWALQLLIHYFDDPNKEEYSRGIRWAAYTALVIPLAGFKDASIVTIDEWLIRAAIIITLYTALAFISGYLASLIKNQFGKPNIDTREFYETALLELESGQLDKGLWSQCLAKSKGKEPAARANYLKARSADLVKLSKSQTHTTRQCTQIILAH